MALRTGQIKIYTLLFIYGRFLVLCMCFKRLNQFVHNMALPFVFFYSIVYYSQSSPVLLFIWFNHFIVFVARNIEVIYRKFLVSNLGFRRFNQFDVNFPSFFMAKTNEKCCRLQYIMLY